MRFYYLVLLFCLLLGCTSIPASTEKNPTLLVGEIVFIGRNYVSANKVSFDGTTTSNIDIFLRNTISNEIIRFSSGKNGLFYVNLQEGKYMIDKLHLKREGIGSAWTSLYYTNPPKIVLEIEREKVNNIGTLRWTFIDKKNNVIQTDDSLSVKNRFSKRFPKSNWNQKEWKYIEGKAYRNARGDRPHIHSGKIAFSESEKGEIKD